MGKENANSSYQVDSLEQDYNEPLMENRGPTKKGKFKYESFKQNAAVNESMSSESNINVGFLGSAPAGGESPDIKVDETIFS